ncbi:MAG: ion transporter [Gemmatimonadota bacterium]|nr:MAG: ion transporter [Gemmatimonadota bacterium]
MKSISQSRGDSFRQLVASIDEMRWEKRPESELREMCRAIEGHQDRIHEDVAKIRTELNSDLEQHDVASFDKHQERVRRLEAQYNSLERMKRKVYATRQRVIVREGMEEVIGARGRAVLERLVLFLIVAVLGILLYEMYHDYELDTTVMWTLYVIDAAACSVFIGEFLWRRKLAEDKSWFWRSNWIDLVSSIPIPPAHALVALDVNTWGRALRLVRILRILRALRIVSFMWRGMERLQEVSNVPLMKKSFIWIAAFIVVGAIGIYYIEGAGRAGEPMGVAAVDAAVGSPEETQITSLPQSMWWSFNAVATGGFAELYKPKRMLAQFITAVLVVAGLAVMGVFIATLAAAYRGEVAEQIRLGQHGLHDGLDNLLQSQEKMAGRLSLIEQQLAQAEGGR